MYQRGFLVGERRQLQPTACEEEQWRSPPNHPGDGVWYLWQYSAEKSPAAGLDSPIVVTYYEHGGILLAVLKRLLKA